VKPLTMRAFDTLYEDEELLVVDKPSGLLTVPSPQEPDKTLTRYVNESFVDQPGRRLYPCHRLDRDTSGAVIFAKNKNVQQLMRLLFERKAVTKKYIAFIRGRLKSPAGQISLPISDFHQRRFSRQKIRPQSAPPSAEIRTNRTTNQKQKGPTV
jgi:23S rRNA pseudouridine1911/1915/1917 synthase